MSRSLFGQESQLLCSIDHPNLANILYKTLDGLAIISEYTELGDLCLLMRRIIENDMNAQLEYVFNLGSGETVPIPIFIQNPGPIPIPTGPKPGRARDRDGLSLLNSGIPSRS
jgi:hypothetical protein